MEAAIKAAIAAAFNAGLDHASRTDLPKEHNVRKLASDKYPNDDVLFEAFMQGYNTMTALIETRDVGWVGADLSGADMRGGA